MRRGAKVLLKRFSPADQMLLQEEIRPGVTGLDVMLDFYRARRGDRPPRKRTVKDRHRHKEGFGAF